MDKPFYEILLKDRLILVLFLLSTLFFIYQHTTSLSWDFAAYSLNAEYLFFGGNYFEWLRAPLSSFLIGIFTLGFIPLEISEIIYIIFVSILFLFSVTKFSEIFEIDATLFYILLINPFLILFGTAVGTELLSLSLLILFIAYIFEKSYVKAGASLALSFLARYASLSYLIISFLPEKFSKNIKSLFILIGTFLILILPWFLFNFYETGHMLTSLGDSHALNVKYRLDYFVGAPQLLDFLLVGNFLIPFFLVGLKKIKIDRKNLAIMIIFIITALSYLVTPLKDSRYLFNLLLPFAYFAYFSVKRIKLNRVIFGFIAAFNLILIFTLSFFVGGSYLLDFPNKEPYDLNEGGCMLASTNWVPVNYMGYTAKPAPREEQLESYIQAGYHIVIYPNGEPQYSNQELLPEKYPLIKKTPYYFIIGNASKCLEIEKVDTTYLENLNEFHSSVYNKTIETNPCKSIELGFLCEIFWFL